MMEIATSNSISVKPPEELAGAQAQRSALGFSAAPPQGTMLSLSGQQMTRSARRKGTFNTG
jgi:hypothetical protein